MWWVCGCRSQLGFNTRNSPSSKFSALRVSSFLSWSMIKSTRPEADISGVFSVFLVFPEKRIWSGFWTTLFGPCPDDPAIDLTVISIIGITTLSIAVKFASWTRFSTAIRALSNSFLIFSVTYLFNILIVTCTVFTGYWLSKIINKTIGLRFEGSILNCIRIGIYTNDEIVWGSVRLAKLSLVLMFPFATGNLICGNN